MMYLMHKKSTDTQTDRLLRVHPIAMKVCAFTCDFAFDMDACMFIVQEQY